MASTKTRPPARSRTPTAARRPAPDRTGPAPGRQGVGREGAPPEGEPDGPGLTELFPTEKLLRLLDTLPAWELRRDGREIAGRFDFPTPRLALLGLNTAAELALYAGVTPHLELEDKRVVVRLSNTAAGGITTMEAAFAQALAATPLDLVMTGRRGRATETASEQRRSRGPRAAPPARGSAGGPRRGQGRPE